MLLLLLLLLLLSLLILASFICFTPSGTSTYARWQNKNTPPGEGVHASDTRLEQMAAGYGVIGSDGVEGT
uniref:Putative secreted peptide n=1 Tax=Anopheles braziliensis TaxID=58242 RepID=A0A2M3ZPM9_9DIPT